MPDLSGWVLPVTVTPWTLVKVMAGPFTAFWATLYIWTMPAWSIKTSGREKIKKKLGLPDSVKLHQSAFQWFHNENNA